MVNKMIKKYPVFLEFVSNRHQLIKPENCSLSENKIKAYLRELSARRIFDESCICSMHARFYNYNNIETNLVVEPATRNNPTESHSGALEIRICNRNGCKCSAHDCPDNIANGKCTDKFVTEIIGKKFFGNKYKNTKQR